MPSFRNVELGLLKQLGPAVMKEYLQSLDEEKEKLGQRARQLKDKIDEINRERNYEQLEQGEK